MQRLVACMAGVPALFYKLLGIVPTLLRMGNILGKPYMRVMTYKTLAFLALKYLGSYHWQYTMIFETQKPTKWYINRDNAPF
jgi:hypothetical protein